MQDKEKGKKSSMGFDYSKDKGLLMKSFIQTSPKYMVSCVIPKDEIKK